MNRFIPQCHQGGFPELYIVVDTFEDCRVSEPKPYHEANDEARDRTSGTYGVPQIAEALWGWAAQIPTQP